MINFLKLKNCKYRIVFVFLYLLLTACGASVQVANGVGGTGITQGPVTSFGSMFVNGIKFNTDNAQFIRDGVEAKKQEDFNTGEIVTIKGTINEDRKTGIATEVIFSDILEGTITSTPLEKSIEVLGQTVSTNNLTVLHGFNELTELIVGNIVEVSGFTSQGKIIASSIQLIDASFNNGSILELEGEISLLDKDARTFKINDLLIDYSTAQFISIAEVTLMNGAYLVVSSTSDLDNNVLKASKVEGLSTSLEANTYYEIEGLVSDFESVTNFKLDNNDAITTTSDTTFSNGSINDIKVDELILVIGTTDENGILLADNIRFFSSDNVVSIEANIESIDTSSNSLIILGQTITLDNFTLISDETTEDFALLDINDFATGDSVFVDAYSLNGSFIANRLSKIAPIQLELIIAVVDSVDNTQSELNVFGITISTNSTTEYYDENGNSISSSSFFSQLNEGSTEVIIEGNSMSNEQLLATSITILNL